MMELVEGRELWLSTLRPIVQTGYSEPQRATIRNVVGCKSGPDGLNHATYIKAIFIYLFI
jgi:hypothetical protein